jgi:type IV pilus assembly protein PilA
MWTARARTSGSAASRCAARLSPLLGAVAEWLRSGLQSRLHRFDSGRRLFVPRLSQIRVVALTALCAALVAVSGCGGGDESKDAKTQDAEAKSDVRNLVSHVEACYAEEQTYDSCGTRLRTDGSGLVLGSAPGEVEVVEVGVQTYAAVGHSHSGTDFRIAKETAGGALRRSCDAPGKGGCSGDGSW